MSARRQQVRVGPAAVLPGMAAWPDTLKLWMTLFKLRIGVSVVFSALGGALLAGGQWPAATDTLILILAVLLASSGAAGFNHYFERDLDAKMRRTRKRPFVTGRCSASLAWPVGFGALMAAGGLLASWRFGPESGLWILGGGLTYGVVYTLWLKRRTHWNIVIGGLAGSWAVLGGAAAVADGYSMSVILLALVLFLWTPSHFWSLAIAMPEDYRRAGVPMLPVVHGPQVAARWILINSLALVASALALAAVVGNPLLWLGTLLGSGYLLLTNLQLYRNPAPAEAMRAFRASLIQLGILLAPLFTAFGIA